MSSALFAVAYLVLIGSVSYLAYHSHIPEPYIVAIVVIMLGIGVVSAMESAREKHTNYSREKHTNYSREKHTNY
jgi:general stress protein CsbA